MEFESQVVKRPPLFKGEKYDLRKLMMTSFLEFSNIDILTIVKRGISRILDSSRNVLNMNHGTRKKRHYTTSMPKSDIFTCACCMKKKYLKFML